MSGDDWWFYVFEFCGNQPSGDLRRYCISPYVYKRGGPFVQTFTTGWPGVGNNGALKRRRPENPTKIENDPANAPGVMGEREEQDRYAAQHGFYDGSNASSAPRPWRRVHCVLARRDVQNTRGDNILLWNSPVRPERTP